MLRLIFFLVLSCLLAWAAVWVVDHPGTVQVRWLEQGLVLSVGTVIVGLLVIGALAIVLFELLRVVVGLPGNWRVGRRRRHEVRGLEELNRGLMAAAAGDLAAARTHHRQAERHLPENGALLLLQAQTAQLEGKEEIAHLKFRQMLDRRDAEFVGLRGLLAQAMKTGDHDEALTLARRAYRRSPTTPWVLTTLLELLGRAGKWEEALPLIDEMQAQKLLSEAEARHKKAVLLHMTATGLVAQDRQSDALSQARRAAKLAPAFAPGVVQAAELALQAGKRRQAVQVLEDAWKVEPHPDVARAYAQIDPAETASQRLKRIDSRLAPLQRDNLETLVLQAEVAMQAGEWDTARTRLEAALNASPTARVYRLLAELERQSRGNQAKAQEWLARATDAPPDRAWVCDDTGEVLPSWRPVAPSGRFDAVHWASPPKVATLLGTEQTTYILAHDDAPSYGSSGAAQAAAAS